MQKSETISSLAKALVAFHVKVGKVKKDSVNPFFSNKYASLSNILETTNDALNECGLAVTQFPVGENGLISILIHAESGEYLESEYHMKPVKDDPQGRGSCLTYMRRYALSSILSLVIDSDDDGNEASGNHSEVKKDPTERPWLNETDPVYLKAIEKMKAGKTSIEAIEKVYKLAKATKAKMIEVTQLNQN